MNHCERSIDSLVVGELDIFELQIGGGNSEFDVDKSIVMSKGVACIASRDQ